LRECLKKRAWVGGVSALKTTTWKLLDVGRLLHSRFNLSRWDNIAGPLHCFYDALLNVRSVSSGYSLLEPSITKIADACSLQNDWGHEVELLFTILRSPESSSIVSNFRRFKISITYCLHLEREKRYEKLLDFLSLLYKDLENFCSGTWPFGELGYDISRKYGENFQEVELDVRKILNRVLPGLSQHISSEKAGEIKRMGRLFETVRREFDLKREAQENRVEAEDDYDQVDDCTSSVKFGVTYTESVITEISFDYSDLYK
jgi:hypothetical protein